MVPKPFPYPFNVGTDICKVSRLAGILCQPSQGERLVRRLFTRLEWPFIWKSLHNVSLLQTDIPSGTDHKGEISYASGEQHAASAKDSKGDSSTWTIPGLSSSSIGLDLRTLSRAARDTKSLFGGLVHHVSGRYIDSATAMTSS